ncbi:MAG: hypothetical protein SA339_06470 [Methanomassiliicoccus sp.]|nr:hypothetical protein [Methanomassiliicoccus sp.]
MMAGSVPLYQRPTDQSQLRACPKCGSLNTLTASYCLGCGEYLPPPVGHPSYQPAVPQPQAKTGLSVPAILLIASAVLLIAVVAIVLIATSV